MPYRLLAASLAAGTLCACAAGVDRQIGEETVDARYAASGGAFVSGATLITFLRVHEAEGRTVVCGAGTGTQPSTTDIGFVDTVLDAGVVQLAGENVLQGIDIFPRHPIAPDMTGVRATCFLTGLAWRPEFDTARPEVSHVRMRFGDDEASGLMVVFRETEVPRLGTEG